MSNILAFWGIYAVSHWYEIAAEQLRALREAKFPATINVHLTGDAHQAGELEELAGWLDVPIKITRYDENCYEYHCLNALWKQCKTLDEVDPKSCTHAPSGPFGRSVLYFHTKAVTHPGWPTYVKWRWMMNYHCLCRWLHRAADLEKYDCVGCAYNDEGPWFAGNFWWARSSWLTQLDQPPPSYQHYHDRFKYERWLLSKPGYNLKSLVSTNGHPYQGDFYSRHGQPHLSFLKRGPA